MRRTRNGTTRSLSALVMSLTPGQISPRRRPALRGRVARTGELGSNEAPDLGRTTGVPALSSSTRTGAQMTVTDGPAMPDGTRIDKEALRRKYRQERDKRLR